MLPVTHLQIARAALQAQTQPALLPGHNEASQLRAGTLNNYTNKTYMFGRLFDKVCFTFFTIAYYWHIGRNKSATNVPNIAGFAFMW